MTEKTLSQYLREQYRKSVPTLPQLIRDFVSCVDIYLDAAHQLSCVHEAQTIYPLAGRDFRETYQPAETCWREAKRDVGFVGARLAEAMTAADRKPKRVLELLNVIERDGARSSWPGDVDRAKWSKTKAWLQQIALQTEQAKESGASSVAGTGEQGEGTGAGRDPAEGEQAEGIDEGTRRKAIARLPRAIRRAFLAFEAVARKVEKRPEDLEDHEAHKLLKEEGTPEDVDDRGELTDYEPPDSVETWRKYLSEARRSLGESKYTSRRRRPHGKSIVRQDQIEPPGNDDR